jgi:hypothetical protein
MVPFHAGTFLSECVIRVCGTVSTELQSRTGFRVMTVNLVRRRNAILSRLKLPSPGNVITKPWECDYQALGTGLPDNGNIVTEC